MFLELDERYKDLPRYISEIKTVADNPYFKNGDYVYSIYLKDLPKSHLINDGDFVSIEGNAGTNNPSHIVRVRIEGDTVYFDPTSTFLTNLPICKIPRNQLDKAPIIGKILFTIANRTNSHMAIHVDEGYYREDLGEVSGNKCRILLSSRKKIL